MKYRRRYSFYGTVQGVGFRFRASVIARSLGLTGWVMNQMDGTVLAEVQGEMRALEEFLQRLKNSPYIDIELIQQQEKLPVEGELRFSVR